MKDVSFFKYEKIYSFLKTVQLNDLIESEEESASVTDHEDEDDCGQDDRKTVLR